MKKESKILEYYVKHYCLPLISFSNNEIEKCVFSLDEINSNEYPKVFFDDNKVSISIDNIYRLIIDNLIISKNYLGIFEQMIMVYLRLIYPYKEHIPSSLFLPYKENSKKIFSELKDEKSVFYSKINSLAIQKSICHYLSYSKTDDECLRIEKLLSILEKWSVKTYEGHKVCFGIVIEETIDKHREDEKIYTEDFLSFLDDEYSAVISDGFSSIFVLDPKCELVKYESITDGMFPNKDSNKKAFLPYRFFEIIYQHTENREGIFLLQNGDIIIVKNREIEFIKRNNKWLNFNRFSFINSIRSSFQYNNEDKYYTDSFFPSIYSTTIDVSLAHTGGIIAVVNKDLFKNDAEIISPIDIIDQDVLSQDNKKYKELFFEEFENKYHSYCKNNSIERDKELDLILSNKNRGEFNSFIEKKANSEIKAINKDIIKRLTKRKFIIKLLNGNNKLVDIDKKLLAELIGLDGACIIDTEGEIIAFGAIITNDAGSSGGGRGAAAKKLSNYGGFAIKISTDGYIEIYSKYELIYSIK